MSDERGGWVADGTAGRKRRAGGPTITSARMMRASHRASGEAEPVMMAAENTGVATAAIARGGDVKAGWSTDSTRCSEDSRVEGGDPSARTPQAAVQRRTSQIEGDPVGQLELAGEVDSKHQQTQRPKPFTVDVRSLVFDPIWYLAQYQDVAAAQLDPVQHYLENGSDEGRDPNPFFSTFYYCERNPDVAASGMNPFLHYVLYGAREGRAPRA